MYSYHPTHSLYNKLFLQLEAKLHQIRAGSELMSILRPFRAIDLFKFNNMYVLVCFIVQNAECSQSNLDIWTETVGQT